MDTGPDGHRELRTRRPGDTQWTASLRQVDPPRTPGHQEGHDRATRGQRRNRVRACEHLPPSQWVCFSRSLTCRSTRLCPPSSSSQARQHTWAAQARLLGTGLRPACSPLSRTMAPPWLPGRRFHRPPHRPVTVLISRCLGSSFRAGGRHTPARLPAEEPGVQGGAPAPCAVRTPWATPPPRAPLETVRALPIGREAWRNEIRCGFPLLAGSGCVFPKSRA